MKARDSGKTHIKGYLKSEDGHQWDEVVGFTVGLKARDLQECSIILDLDKELIKKNVLNSTDAFKDLYDYFNNAYGQHMIQFMARTAPKPSG